jgi:1-acyl-sn-glycerol-3-phosphate acyltransferase
MLLTFIKAIGRPLFRVLFSAEYHGLENVPENGSVIIAGNHPSYLDPALVMLPLKRPVRFMAWDALFNIPLFGRIIRALGAFPVDLRKGKGEAAYRQAVHVLERGDVLGIFPEGRRSEWGVMGELRNGVARLAIETGAPIVPVTIGGAFRAWPKWKLLPKPAKIIVRYHQPILLSDEDRRSRGDDRDFHQQIMQLVAATINRSLIPALRSAEALERWYRRPPSHIRTFEWAPLIAMLLALWVSAERGTLNSHWTGIVALPAIYYFYLICDLALIKPSRTAKWLRNSAPVWLILSWHYPLTSALILPAGERNYRLVAALLAAFFPFFYEDYYSLQKFVRGLVTTYYLSLALLLLRPDPLGCLVSILVFITIFVFWYRVIYKWWIAIAMSAVLISALWVRDILDVWLLLFALLGLVVNAYLQSFISMAYDIRKAGDVELEKR